jgi:hypothetical protein
MRVDSYVEHRHNCTYILKCSEVIILTTQSKILFHLPCNPNSREREREREGGRKCFIMDFQRFGVSLPEESSARIVVAELEPMVSVFAIGRT